MEEMQVDWDPIEFTDPSQPGLVRYRPQPIPDYSRIAFWLISALVLLIVLIPMHDDTFISVLFRLGIAGIAICWFARLFSVILWKQKVQREMSLRKLAETGKWTACVVGDAKRWAELCKKYPEAFSVNKPYAVRSQLWGIVQPDGIAVPFWYAEMHPLAKGSYSLRINNGINEGHTVQSTQEQGIVATCAIPLPLSEYSPLLVEPDYGSAVRGNDIEFESIDFNRMFKVKGTAEAAFTILNPVVMQKLMDFQSQFGEATFLFSEGTLIVLLPSLLKYKETSVDLLHDLVTSLADIVHSLP